MKINFVCERVNNGNCVRCCVWPQKMQMLICGVTFRPECIIDSNNKMLRRI